MALTEVTVDVCESGNVGKDLMFAVGLRRLRDSRDYFFCHDFSVGKDLMFAVGLRLGLSFSRPGSGVSCWKRPDVCGGIETI